MPTRSRHRFLGRTLFLALPPAAAPLIAGCAAVQPDQGARRGTGGAADPARNAQTEAAPLPADPAPDRVQNMPQSRQVTPLELRERNRAFADRYRVVLAKASDTIMRRRDDPLLRQKAHQLKIDGATAIYDIVIDPSPRTALLNLVVQITLQKKLADSSAAADFPEDHPLIQESVTQLYDEVWTHASLVMQERERTELLGVIDRWWEDRAGEQGIWYVRLSDLAGYGSGTSLEGLIGSARGLPSSLLNTFVPLGDASESLDEITVVSESATWFAPRLIVLTQWRLEAIVFETLATTELTGTVDAVQRLVATAETLPQDVGREVNATIEALAEREASLSPLLDRTEAVIASAGATTSEATELVRSLEQTTNALTGLSESLKPLLAQFDKDETEDEADDEAPGRPFDITEYTETVRALEDTLEEAAALVDRIEVTTGPMALEARAEAISGHAGRLILYAALAVISVVASIAFAVIAVRRWGRRPDHAASPL